MKKTYNFYRIFDYLNQRNRFENENKELTEEEIPSEALPYLDTNTVFPNPDILKYYRDKEQRIIWLTEEIDENSYYIVDQILEYNTLDKDIPIEERTPIRLIIDSPGGDVYMSFVLANIVGMSTTPIFGYAFGQCSSGASLIYLACHRKYALPTTTFLFHKGSCHGIGGTYDQVHSFMNVYTTQIKWLVDFYKKNTKYDPIFIEEKLNGSSDWYILPSEGLENGVIDEIITDLDLIIFPKI